MTRLLRKMFVRKKWGARLIALLHCGWWRWQVCGVYEELPSNCCPYALPSPQANFWFVLCIRRQLIGLMSSRLLCIDRKTGNVEYDDSARDEG